jgi:type IV pilus assembly protein PilO
MNLSELKDLDFSNVASWPPLAKAVAAVLMIVVVTGLGYYFFTRHQLESLNSVRLTEQQLREEFMAKQRVMANIDAYRAQIEEMQTTLDAMLRQLPTRTEMPDLLEDVSNTGKQNGLQFELFKPEDEQPREFYSAKPISIRARANYHQFGAFVSSVAALSRIVTLENATLVDPQQTGNRSNTTASASVASSRPLVIEATLQTYRYLDEDTEEGASTRQGAGGG